jgi:hypothetical protein
MVIPKRSIKDNDGSGRRFPDVFYPSITADEPSLRLRINERLTTIFPQGECTGNRPYGKKL